MTREQMTREQMVTQLVTISTQWGFKDSKGRPITPATFANATDAWLKKQIKFFEREGAKMATHQS